MLNWAYPLIGRMAAGLTIPVIMMVFWVELRDEWLKATLITVLFTTVNDRVCEFILTEIPELTEADFKKMRPSKLSKEMVR